MRRIIRGLLIGAIAVIAVVILFGVIVNKKRPIGLPGPDADAMAHRMLDQVNADAWSHTGAVAWSFNGRHEHLWDRARGFERVRKGNREVMLRLDDHTGIVRENGQVLTGKDADDQLEQAWALWANDSFWLNPAVKAFDDGVERSIVHDNEGDHLLVQYDEGGVTPGDAYMWYVGDGRPTAWRMWVKVLPIGGLRASWEDWTQLATGAWVATKHTLGPLTLRLTDVRGAATLTELEPNGDPFAELVR